MFTPIVLFVRDAPGDLSFDGPAAEAANALTSALEGAMLLARSDGDPSRIVTAADRLLRAFAPATRDGDGDARPLGADVEQRIGKVKKDMFDVAVKSWKNLIQSVRDVAAM